MSQTQYSKPFSEGEAPKTQICLKQMCWPGLAGMHAAYRHACMTLLNWQTSSQKTLT